jgi:hypothetical protein
MRRSPPRQQPGPWRPPHARRLRPTPAPQPTSAPPPLPQVNRLPSGQWALKLKVANERKHQILNPNMKMLLTAIDSITPDKYVFEYLAIEQLDAQQTNIQLGFPATLTHIIRPGSPLYSLSLEEMRARMMEIIVFVDGVDSMTSKMMQVGGGGGGWWAVGGGGRSCRRPLAGDACWPMAAAVAVRWQREQLHSDRGEPPLPAHRPHPAPCPPPPHPTPPAGAQGLLLGRHQDERAVPGHAPGDQGRAPGPGLFQVRRHRLRDQRAGAGVRAAP